MILAVEFFIFVLLHAEFVIGLGRPILQVLNNDLAVRIVALVLLKNHFSFSIVHLRPGYSGLFVNIPGETLRMHVELLPFERV